MSWIKRNLFFVVGSAVALVLMGLAGWFLYSKWSLNNEAWTSLNGDYEKLKSFNSKTPHPGAGQVNNITLAREQREQLLALAAKATNHFEPIAPIPGLPRINDQEFSSALSQTIERLQQAATNAGVTLPANYNFSFQAQFRLISFQPSSLPRLAVQLGEIKALADVLFQAKINSLDGIRRERISTDDSRGPLSDYLSEKSVTNRLDALNLTAILTPYEVTFRGFSTELAAVLSGLANSPHCFIVKNVNVEQAPYVAPEPTAGPTVDMAAAWREARSLLAQQQQQAMAAQAAEAEEQRARANAAASMAARYGRGAAAPGGVAYQGVQPGMQPMPAYPAGGYQPVAAQAANRGPQTVLDEKQLKVTMNLLVIKPVLTNPK